MRIRRIISSAAAALALALAASHPGAQQSPGNDGRTFQTGIVGSAPRGAGHPGTALSTPEVRALIVALADSGVPMEDARKRLAQGPYSLHDLSALGLVAVENGRLRLAFNFLSADDQRRIAAAGREHGRALADRILARKNELAAAASPLGATADDRRSVLFFVIGCMALDWQGLEFTARAGYRTDATVVGPSFAYTPWMKEDAPDISRRGLYWGSHNAPAGEYTFTTFGDHHALPRRALPDLVGRGDVPFTLSDLARVLAVAADGRATPAPGAALDFLEQLGYLERSQGRLDVRVPLLQRSDAGAVRQVSAIVMEEVEAWHRESYPALRAGLENLTPGRHGVPFPVVYTEIWHYVFGYANLYLSEAGLLADPYAPRSPHRGFVPVLWHNSLSR